MAKFEVRILTEPEYSQWDQFVEQSVQGTVFHSSSWITPAAKMLQFDPVIIGVFDTAQIMGAVLFSGRISFPFSK